MANLETQGGEISKEEVIAREEKTQEEETSEGQNDGSQIPVNEQKAEQGSEAPKPSEEKETPEKTDESDKTEKSKDLQSALAQKDWWRKKAEEAQKKLQKQTLKKEESPDEWKMKVDFLLANRDKNYSEDEFDHIASVAERKGISLEEAAKSEEDYINYQRDKVAQEKKTPESSSPAASGSKIDLEKAAQGSTDDWAKTVEKLNKKGSEV